MPSRNCEIVDSGVFCEVIFFSISPKTLLGNFFDSLAILPANNPTQKVAIFKPFLLKSGRILRFLNWHDSFNIDFFQESSSSWRSSKTSIGNGKKVPFQSSSFTGLII